MNKVLVSIWCTTYNHEKYIKDAIESFLAQKTNFQYEIIIHDDASTDGTAEIIREYEQRYPNLIHAIYQRENQYSKNQPSIKWIQDIAIENCSGKYIAICEGDDYWTDKQKLQLQVDYLEEHPKCIMAVHDVAIEDCRFHSTRIEKMYESNCYVGAGDVIEQNCTILSSSTVYRREVLEMNDFFLNSGIGDYPCLLYSFTLGYIYYFNRVMSVYRQYHEGSWTNSTFNKDIWFMHNVRTIDFLKKYNKYTKHEYENHTIIRIQKSAMRCLECYSEMNKEEFSKMLKNFEIKMGKEYQEVLKQLERLKIQLSNEKYIHQKTRSFAEKYKHIVIMGAGTYAGILSKQMQCQKIDFEGFVVSKSKQVINNYLDKSVWQLDSVPFDLRDTGIIIGINPVIWDQIIVALTTVKAENYICPFLLDY